MATRGMTVSLQIEDDAGKVAALPIYVTFDDSTATLSSIAAAVATIIDDVDAIIDGVVRKVSYTISQALPTSGIKTTPVAGSNVQETGLFSFVVDGTPYRWAVAIPSVAAAVQDQGNIPDAGDVSTLKTLIVNDSATFRWVEPVSQNGLVEPMRSGVTFRKHG